ncbi:MAG: type III-A CRISPR-associated RAMP protein Csm5 [Rhodocyclaceae bacterium]|nr:type III-A CRISPR-associated RAMP protein Csm5 [Rhodocyclaceae bacterium]
MMNFLETHELVISTLSPVHIGCGEDYEPTNYVIEGESLYAFDPALLLARLESRQRDELMRALDDRNPVLAAQRFFYRHRETAVAIASHSAPVVPAAARFYAARIGQVANREAGGAQVINKLEIARTAFDPTSGLPILPGSSLKGAMRTAVLEALRARTGRRYPVTDQEAARNNEAARKAKDMERDLFGGSLHTDPFRLVKVSDATFLPGSYKAKNSKGEEIQRERQPRTILFQANRKKRPNAFESKGNIETLLECIPAGQPRAFTARLTIEHKANHGEDTPTRQFDFATIAKACNTFYLTRLESELEMLIGNGYVSPNWAKNARLRLAPEGLWGRAIAEGRGFLLRIGRHCGAESVTIDAPRKIKIMKGGGQPPAWAVEATTVWLAAQAPDAKSDMWPFGWVFVQQK